MAVSYSVFDESTGRSRSITVDFLGSVLAQSLGDFDSGWSYYFRIRTSARDADGNPLPENLILDIDELALNGIKQARSDTAAAYVDINDMIEDYLYDYVNGHDANKHGSGVSYRAPMQF